MELNKIVKGKDNFKDSLPDNKRASPNNEQPELAFFSPTWGNWGEGGEREALPALASMFYG